MSCRVPHRGWVESFYFRLRDLGEYDTQRVSTRASQYSQKNRDIMTRSYGPRRSLELALQALLFRLPAVVYWSEVLSLPRNDILDSARNGMPTCKRRSQRTHCRAYHRCPASRQYVHFFSRTVMVVERQRGQIGKEALLIVVVDVNDSTECVPIRT